ncbi:MAG TPA: hypothetical protein VH393_03520 [Ktedonobacterales bacterium]
MPGAIQWLIARPPRALRLGQGFSALYLELPEQYKEVYRSGSDQYGEITG